MKKILLIAAIVFFAFQYSNAQTEKGSQTLGFNLGYTTNTSNETLHSSFNSTVSTAKTKTTDFSIGPNYSYFIADNLDLGASLQYGSNVETDYPINGQFGNKNLNRSFGASLYLRKYFLYANKIGIRTGPYATYNRAEQKNTDISDGADPANDEDSKTNTFSAGLNLDLVYFPSKRLGFAATIANLDYQHFKRNDTPSKDSETGNGFNFNIVNNGLLLSVFFVFGSK